MSRFRPPRTSALVVAALAVASCQGAEQVCNPTDPQCGGDGSGASPVASITAPGGGTFSERIDIDFTGSATDAEDGALSGPSLQWASSVDGALGSGADLTVSTLSPGAHTITLTAIDGDGNVDADQVVIEVVAIPGGRIAYTFGEPPDAGIGIVESDGANPTVLLCCADHKDPAWSPDGSRIAFHSAGGFFGFDTLHFIDPDGTNLQKTTLIGSEFAFSPTGADVAFTRAAGGGVYQLFRADIDSEADQQLTTEGKEFDPAWSPDGTQIAYESGADVKSIMVIQADGSGTAESLTAPGNGSPAWSPDGSRIAFESDRGGNTDVWIMNADGSDPVQVTHDVASDRDPVWSPDGEWLAFASDRAGDFSIYVVFIAGTGAPILLDAPDTSDENHPSWEP